MSSKLEYVSCRALGLHRKVAEQLRVPLGDLLAGTGIDVALVDTKAYLPWAQFARSVEKLEEAVGGRTPLRAYGRLVNQPDTHPAFARILGHVLDLRVLAEAAARWAAPSFFPCVTFQLSWIGRRRVLYQVEIPRTLQGCEPFLVVATAAMRSVPSWLGLPDLEGTEVIEDAHYAWADLTLPRTPSLRARLATSLGYFGSGKQLVDELVAQNTELRQQKAELVVAKQEAEAHHRRAEHASRMKSEFVAAVSHEMRTPLNSLIIATQLLKDSHLDDGQREHVEVVLRASGHMTRVLEDLIDLEGIEAGRLRFEPRPFAVRRLVEEAAGMLRKDADARGLSLILDIAPDVPRLLVGDAARVRQILLNLVGNALRYTQVGEVRVTLHHDTSGLRIEVSDTGPGLADDERERIFQPFVQGKARGHTRGAGLGLAITRHLVQRMEGEIGVESRVGHGATFWCRLPFAPPVAAVEAHGAELVDERGRPVVRRQVLLVEDDEVTRKVFSRLLETLGCEVDVAEDGARAVATCAGKRYDLVLMDCQMPVMGGFEATRAIRDLPGPNQDTCIVGLTAGTWEAEPSHWGAAGMTNLLHKPLDTGTLRTLLESLPLRAGSAA